MVWFDPTDVPPMLVEKFPFDKYELEPSPLTQCILGRRNANICWQVRSDTGVMGNLAPGQSHGILGPPCLEKARDRDRDRDGDRNWGPNFMGGLKFHDTCSSNSVLECVLLQGNDSPLVLQI